MRQNVAQEGVYIVSTPTQDLASHLLGRPVTEWISERRAEGLSYQHICIQLHSRTGVAVSDETMRRWLSADAA